MMSIFFFIGASLVTGAYILVLLKMMDVADKMTGTGNDRNH